MRLNGNTNIIHLLDEEQFSFEKCLSTSIFYLRQTNIDLTMLTSYNFDTFVFFMFKDFDTSESINSQCYQKLINHGLLPPIPVLEIYKLVYKQNIQTFRRSYDPFQ